jgi:hypothetical protein
MLVNGCDCSIIIKTTHKEMDIPYCDETLREAVSFLEEEASIEGDGVKRGLQKISGITGCVVTPLTINTAPLLLYLAMGAADLPVFVSGTKNLYQYRLELFPMEDAEYFDLIQDRSASNKEQVTNNKERKIYEGCHVLSFELRIMRDEAIKLKLDICGDNALRAYPYTDVFEREVGERFSGDCVIYAINGKEYKNIYGITLSSKKEGGTKTELWIKRTLQHGSDIPEIIEDITITAQLWRDVYEYRRFGTFRITLKQLVLVCDETEVNASGAVMSPLRYYVSGEVSAEVFESGERVQ